MMNLRPRAAAAFFVLAAALGAPLFSPCHAQHEGDVLISVDDDRLKIENPLAPGDVREFDLHGDGTVYRTDDPGYNTIAFGTLNSGTEIHFEVVTPLYAWLDGTWATAADGEYLRYYNASLPDLRSVTATGTSAEQPGYLLARASALGAIHVHDVFELGSTPGVSPEAGAYAIGKKLVSPSYDESSPFFIVFNNGLSSHLFDEAFVAAQSLGSTEAVLGDFNGDGALTAEDIDLLGEALHSGNSDPIFDLNNDDAVDGSDYQHWVIDAKQTWVGDSNLDGQFDSGDVIAVFQAGEFEDNVPHNSRWATGDWNGDRDFGTGDLISAFQFGGYGIGPRTVGTATPEPQSGVVSLIVFASGAMLRTRKVDPSKRKA